MLNIVKKKKMSRELGNRLAVSDRAVGVGVKAKVAFAGRLDGSERMAVVSLKEGLTPTQRVGVRAEPRRRENVVRAPGMKVVEHSGPAPWT